MSDVKIENFLNFFNTYMFIFSYDKINSVGIFGQIFVKNLFNIKMYFLRIKWQHLYKNF